MLKRAGIMFSIIVCMLIIVVGCSNESGNGTKTSTDNKANEQNQGSSDKVDKTSGGTFTVAVSADALKLGNPPTVMNQADPDYASPAVERLFRRDNQGLPVPFLAESYKVADDNLSITIELKQGIKFHDGSDFNANVVKWNLDRYIETKRAELAKVSAVNVTGDYTVELQLTEYDGLLLQYLSTIAGMMVSQKSVEENGDEWAEVNPVGTGAYKFVSWERDQRITYEAFDGYWQGTPNLDKIVMEVIVDPFTQIAAFESGEVDAIMSLSPKDANDLKQMNKYELDISDLAASVLGLLPDSANEGSKYADKKVRQAVWHAIDFEAIANTLGYGYHEATFQLATKGSAAYNPDVKGYPYDPEKAKALLKEAGFEKGFATSLIGQNNSNESDILTAVQAYLQDVGITAKVELVDPGKYFEMLTGGPEKGGWTDGMMIVPFTISPNELGAYSRLLGPGISSTRLPVLFHSDEAQELIGKAGKEADPDKVKETTHQLQKVVTDDHATLHWIYAFKKISANHPKVKGTNFSTPQWTPEQVTMEE